MTDLSHPVPLVSICVPTYNGAAYLQACLTSIQSQTFGDFEVVLTDDASSDDTLAIARTFAQQDKRFQIHPNPQRLGLVGNWNQGLRRARGEWIKPVFQDDLLRPECLERMVAVARQENAQFLACGRDFQFEGPVTAETQAFYATSAAGIAEFFGRSKTCSPPDFAKAILECVGANFIGEPTVTLLHRELFDRCGLFNEHLIMCCDSEFWYRAGTHTPVRFMPETLATFRVHGTSASAANFGRRRFRMDLLDPLLVVHAFIHHPAYELLREVARAQFGARHLEYELRARARRAWAAWQEKQAMNSADAPLCRQEWEAVCQTCPELLELTGAPKMGEKIWAARRTYSPRKLAGKILRAAGLRK